MCIPGDGFREVVQVQPGTAQPQLLPFYCMTTSENLTERRDVIGGCLFTTNTPKLMRFFPLPCNISELNQFMCADMNRMGQLCGKCAHGYAPAAYSYTLECVNCTDSGGYNWLKYSAIAFGPLTLFCTIIIALHISATSPYFHGYVLFCQFVCLPTVLRLFVTSHSYEYYQNTKWFINVYMCLVGIWNLDFFRLVYKPFCLHPNITVMQTLVLDYLIAFYPLFLLLVTYSLASLCKRNGKVVVILWKPLRQVLRPLSHDLDIRTTLIESFSTLYLLSVVKIQSVSLDLLLPTTLYYSNGKKKGYYLYLAADVLYFWFPSLSICLACNYFVSTFCVSTNNTAFALSLSIFSEVTQCYELQFSRFTNIHGCISGSLQGRDGRIKGFSILFRSFSDNKDVCCCSVSIDEFLLLCSHIRIVFNSLNLYCNNFASPENAHSLHT